MRELFSSAVPAWRISWPRAVVLRVEEEDMLLGEVLGFWLIVGVAFFGWRRRKNSKESEMPHVLPPANGRRA